MGSLTPNQLESRLRKRLNAFLKRDSAWRPALEIVEEAATRRGWRLLLFGGTLRDLCLRWSAAPRDLDFVVPGASLDDLKVEFASYLERQTRFGGLHLRIKALPVDIWPLEQTWAFREGLISGNSPEALPRTTFLTSEAAAVELQTRKGRPRSIYSEGLFESFATSTLEINLEDNPSPDLCVVRTLVTLRKLRFAVGPRLADYLVNHGTRLPMEQLENTQLAHYGSVVLSRDRMWKDLNEIGRQKAEGRSTVRLPFAVQRKLPCEPPAGTNLAFRFASNQSQRRRAPR